MFLYVLLIFLVIATSSGCMAQILKRSTKKTSCLLMTGSLVFLLMSIVGLFYIAVQWIFADFTLSDKPIDRDVVNHKRLVLDAVAFVVLLY